MHSLSVIQQFSVWIIPVLFAITVHETAHGYIASKLGDNSAKMMGRLTLNPLKHIDPVGTILVPAAMFFLSGFVFGWAKPVPVNFSALKSPRRDMALVAIAGPASNFLMAIAWTLILKLIIFINYDSYILVWLMYSCYAGISINLILGLLNLLPILPLDGGRIVNSFLPPRLSIKYEKSEPYGFFILIGLLVLGWLGIIIGPILHSLQSFLFSL